MVRDLARLTFVIKPLTLERQVVSRVMLSVLRVLSSVMVLHVTTDSRAVNGSTKQLFQGGALSSEERGRTGEMVFWNIALIRFWLFHAESF